MPQDRLLPLPELEHKIGFKKSKIYDWIANGAFPPGKLVLGKRLWLESEIDEWIAAEWEKAS